MLILECSQGCYGRTDGRTVFLSDFRKEDLNVKVYNVLRTDDGHHVMGKSYTTRYEQKIMCISFSLYTTLIADTK